MARASFFCLDGHTCGNPVRLVVGGAPQLRGKTMSDKRQDFLAHYDWIRTGLTYEPRGHDLMSGAILYPAYREDCDASLLFIETTGCLPMCGHVTIGAVTMGIENELIRPEKPGYVRFETPAGLVTAYYQEKEGRVHSVKFINAPAFLYDENLSVSLKELGEIKFDVAYGGNFYAIIESQKHYQDFHDVSVLDLVKWSYELRARINEKYRFIHPEDQNINGVSHILWAAPPCHNNQADASNAVFYGKKAIDRSPCGTGTSARMAQLWSRGHLKKGQKFVHESLIGTLFEGMIEGETQLGDYAAIIPSISGWARQTGVNTLYIDHDDPFAKGFLLQ